MRQKRSGTHRPKQRFQEYTSNGALSQREACRGRRRARGETRRAAPASPGCRRASRREKPSRRRPHLLAAHHISRLISPHRRLSAPLGESRRISAHLGSSLPSEGSSSASGARYLRETGRDRSEKRPFWPEPGTAPRARRPLQRAPRPARTWSGRLPEIPRLPEITCATACPNLVGERWKGERTSKPASQRRAGARSIDCSRKGPTLCSALGDSLRLSRRASTAAGRGGR